MNKLLLILFAMTSLAYGDSITLKSGETIQGELLETKAGFVLLRLPESEGEALRRLSPDNIESLAFSDPKAPLEEQALKRSKFITLLSEDDARQLPRYLNLLLSNHQALTALSYAKLWHPKNKYPSLDPNYREILIKSSLAAELPDEALVHAQTWLSQTPPPIKHPLPWEIQAQRFLDTGQFEEALWTCLTPLAHASGGDQDKLARLRELASASYQSLGYLEHAQAYLSATPQPTQPLHFTPHNPPN